MINRIALGSVQFGLPYGVANKSGQLKRDEAAIILKRAKIAGIDTVDTAKTYGESEKRLGEIGIDQWKVITKLPAIPIPCEDVVNWVLESIMDSLAQLKIKRLYGVLLHNSNQLLDYRSGQIYKALNELKKQDLVQKIGVSIYNPEELDTLWDRFELDIVQAPFNILDRRLVLSGWLDRLREANIEVHCRSVFLQGLLLMEYSNRAPYFNRWQSLWTYWHRWLDEQLLTSLEACLRFSLSQNFIDRFVIGVDNLKQLDEIISIVNYENFRDNIYFPTALESKDLDLINPSHWNLH